jgi:hypothetical protein
MTTYDFDAFGNPMKAAPNGQPQTVFLHSDGIYDPMLAPSYLLPRHRDPMLGRFTNFDIHEGEILAPASLQKFRYAGQTPIHATDPSRASTPAEKRVCQGV